jgi:hypothetical protein
MLPALYIAINSIYPPPITKSIMHIACTPPSCFPFLCSLTIVIANP